MTDERRDQWKCARILHGGDGPEITPWFVILGVYDITADQAAQCYAEDRMGGVDDPDYGDGDCMLVAVETQPGRVNVYRCRKHLDVRVEPRLDCERTDLVPTTRYSDDTPVT